MKWLVLLSLLVAGCRGGQLAQPSPQRQERQPDPFNFSADDVIQAGAGSGDVQVNMSTACTHFVNVSKVLLFLCMFLSGCGSTPISIFHVYQYEIPEKEQPDFEPEYVLRC